MDGGSGFTRPRNVRAGVVCRGVPWRVVLAAACDPAVRVLVTQARLPKEVNRVLYVRNLPYKITAEEMYDIFGKYGAIRQIRK